MKRIGFLGLGAMGSRMASNLIKAGFDVTVWNRDGAKASTLGHLGAKIAQTPREAAQGADVVISMVRDDEASHDVWFSEGDGAAFGLAPETVAIECSTLTPAWIKSLAERLNKNHGVSMLDAPVAGSLPQAEAGQLIFLVGGAADLIEVTRPALGAMGSVIHECGNTGSGSAVKLAINALFAIQVAGLAEIFGMLGASGVDLPKAMGIIGATRVASPALNNSAAAMLAGDFRPQFPVALVVKDLGYIEAAASALGQQTPLSHSAGQVMRIAIERGFGEDSLTGIVRLYL